MPTTHGTTGVCAANAPTRFVDNGNGTICDNKTGLMWEKKLATDGSDGGNCNTQYDEQDSRDAHCVNNVYHDRREISYLPTYQGFIEEMNSEVNIAEKYRSCFADYCDWRMPKPAELLSIVLDPCTSEPCIDPTFGPTSVVEGNIEWRACYFTTMTPLWVCFNLDKSTWSGGIAQAIWVRAVRSTR